MQNVIMCVESASFEQTETGRLNWEAGERSDPKLLFAVKGGTLDLWPNCTICTAFFACVGGGKPIIELYYRSALYVATSLARDLQTSAAHEYARLDCGSTVTCIICSADRLPQMADDGRIKSVRDDLPAAFQPVYADSFRCRMRHRAIER